MRKLQSGQTSGKIVVDHHVSGQVKTTHPPRSTTLLQRHATYIIIGETGGLGRSMAKRMAELGAGHIVLLSRSGNITGDLKQLMQQAQAAGSSIHVKSCDVADEANVAALMAEIQMSMPPVRGVIHAVMVLKDVLFESMKFDDYQSVVRSKTVGTWNMHKALLDSPLDFFFVLSSVSGIVGSRGQAAYAAANTFLDAFVRYRIRNGLAAASLDLAAVSDAGYIAENEARQAEILKNASSSHERGRSACRRRGRHGGQSAVHVRWPVHPRARHGQPGVASLLRLGRQVRPPARRRAREGYRPRGILVCGTPHRPETTPGSHRRGRVRAGGQRRAREAECCLDAARLDRVEQAGQVHCSHGPRFAERNRAAQLDRQGTAGAPCRYSRFCTARGCTT